MVKVIGVRFRRAGKLYYFAPGPYEIHHGDKVIVETARGTEIGEVVHGEQEVDELKIVQPLREVIRMAGEEDLRHEAENQAKQKEAFRICKEKIIEHQLEMKLIDCEYTFDNSKILFYFTADGRIDFRELVKDLAAIFRTRIELRQVGVRDETKLLGGIGICGRPLCCSTYLSDFIPVSIKMAKEQNLSLNPTKISGVCGRLMCCLKNEEEVYEELNRNLPKNGDYATTPDGLSGEVQSVSILKQLVKVVVTLPNDEKEVREYPAAELSFRPRKRGKRGEDPGAQQKPNAQKGTADGKPASAPVGTEKAQGAPEKRSARKPKDISADNETQRNQENQKRGPRGGRNRSQENGSAQKKPDQGKGNGHSPAGTRNDGQGSHKEDATNAQGGSRWRNRRRQSRNRRPEQKPE